MGSSECDPLLTAEKKATHNVSYIRGKQLLYINHEKNKYFMIT